MIERGLYCINHSKFFLNGDGVVAHINGMTQFSHYIIPIMKVSGTLLEGE